MSSCGPALAALSTAQAGQRGAVSAEVVLRLPGVAEACQPLFGLPERSVPSIS
jgi:hypothetical protein